MNFQLKFKTVYFFFRLNKFNQIKNHYNHYNTFLHREMSLVIPGFWKWQAIGRFFRYNHYSQKRFLSKSIV